MILKRIAIIAELSDGTYRQVAAKEEELTVIMHTLNALHDGTVKIMPTTLSITFEKPYPCTK